MHPTMLSCALSTTVKAGATDPPKPRLVRKIAEATVAAPKPKRVVAATVSAPTKADKRTTPAKPSLRAVKIYYDNPYSSSNKVVKEPAQNLNLRVSSAERAAVTAVENVASVQVVFQDIASRIVEQISRVPYVVGCVAWMSNAVILAKLAERDGVSIVVKNDKILKYGAVLERYSKLKPFRGQAQAVRCVGLRSKKGDTMHHKFLVGLDEHESAQWVITGSYNATEQAEQNIENAVILTDKTIANAYLQEYKRVIAVSKPIIGAY
jgi:phosphatidylserine/phosphatidylglycerophosphate/cardiolipin synthase-like enzyme